MVKGLKHRIIDAMIQADCGHKPDNVCTCWPSNEARIENLATAVIKALKPPIDKP